MSTINLTAVYEPCDEGGFIAYIDEIQGINSQGETMEEAKENLADAINLLFEEIRSEHSQVTSKKIQKLIKQTLTFNL
ncbi:MAG: type II toxin-antitoxin system HicB family antitoxin [Bacteroidales bacterium]|nr:type II toxin-antitoxin system HicB family antitoxin [Bacteroidales bacterium]